MKVKLKQIGKVSFSTPDIVDSRRLFPFIKEILDTFGVNFFSATEESLLQDLHPSDDALQMASCKFGFTLHASDSLIDVARKIRSIREVE